MSYTGLTFKGSADPARVPAGAAGKAYINLYGMVLDEGDNVWIAFYHEENKDYAPMFASASSATLAGCTSTHNDTHLTFTKDSSASSGPYTGTVDLVLPAMQGYTAKVYITNAGNDGNAMKTIDTSRINVPDFYGFVDKYEVSTGNTPNSRKIYIKTNKPQYVEVIIAPGSIDGEDIINNVSYEGDSNCGSIVHGNDGIYRVNADAHDLSLGTYIQCTIIVTYEKNFVCTDDCSNAPKLSVINATADNINILDSLTDGEATIKIARTHGPFSSDTAGFAIYADYYTGADTVTIDNDFGITYSVPIYDIGQTEVGNTSVGDAIPSGTGHTTISIHTIENKNPLFGFFGYVAIPVFEASADMLPTIKDLKITASVGNVVSDPILISNADTVIDMTTADVPDVIRELTELTLGVNFTSNHLDELTLKIDFSKTGATFNACEDNISDMEGDDADLQEMLPMAAPDVKDGVLTIPISKTDATVENSTIARYSYMCSFTTAAVTEGAVAATVPIHVLLGDDILKTTDLTVAASKYEPIAGTKVVAVLNHDALFHYGDLATLLNSLVEVVQTLDSSFNILRLFEIFETLNKPMISSVNAASTATVTLSTSFSDVAVTNHADLAVRITSAFESLGFTASVSVDNTEIEVECVLGCGFEQCGLCMNGKSCTDKSNCFSDKCNTEGKCGDIPNSAAAISVIIAILLAAASATVLL
jgi:hypothetical protein